MGDGLQFEHVCGDKNAAMLDIVFIHGIAGDPKETWTNLGGDFWPSWLADDLSGVCIHTAGYPASVFAKWAKKEMTLHERASSLAEHIVSHGIGRRPLVIICHSLGGLLAKEMFRACCEAQDEDWNALGDQLRLVVFFATPHKGAVLAAIVKALIPRVTSPSIEALSNDAGYLTNLNNGYRDLAVKKGLTTVAYYEKYKTGNAALVVSEESADPGCTKTRPIPVDADHIAICKPVSKDAPAYLSVRRHIGKVLDRCPTVSVSVSDPDGGLGPDDYSMPSELDRRTLHAKLIDAGREYEYSNANSLQNRFARKYHKLGLFTEAKTRHDSILSAVEQRFLTHVYGPKICAGAPESEIAAAVQEHVIDPLCASPEHRNLSNSTILQALYYLTEQCHIQWDKP
jgi:protein SERAC1